MMYYHNYLKRSRKRSNISSHDMAYLLDYDVSNLSNYERGEKNVPLHIYLAYHIVSGEPLHKFFLKQISQLIDTLRKRAIELSSILEDEPQTEKNRRRMVSLEEVLLTIGSLKDLIEKDASPNEYEE